MNAYRKDLRDRVIRGAISQGEANILAAFALDFEAAGTVRAVICPACKTQHPLVGEGQTFACPCSPTITRSVWDNRA